MNTVRYVLTDNATAHCRQVFHHIHQRQHADTGAEATDYRAGPTRGSIQHLTEQAARRVAADVSQLILDDNWHPVRTPLCEK